MIDYIILYIKFEAETIYVSASIFMVNRYLSIGYQLLKFTFLNAKPIPPSLNTARVSITFS